MEDPLVQSLLWCSRQVDQSCVGSFGFGSQPGWRVRDGKPSLRLPRDGACDEGHQSCHGHEGNECHEGGAGVEDRQSYTQKNRIKVYSPLEFYRANLLRYGSFSDA